jgi:hypothetical protein
MTDPEADPFDAFESIAAIMGYVFNKFGQGRDCGRERSTALTPKADIRQHAENAASCGQ